MKLVRIILIHFATLLVVLNSKSVFYGILHSSESKGVLLIVVLALFAMQCIVRKRYAIKKDVLITISMLLFLLLASDLYNGTGFNGVSVFLACFVIAILYSQVISKDEFMCSYINVMVVIAVISLICSAIKIASPGITNIFLSQRYQLEDSYYIASPLYTWGTFYIDPRNYGPFWEPGAFQIYLNIAILFLIATNTMLKKGKFIILVVALLTTMSTTGYIIAAIMVLFFYDDILAIVVSRKKRTINPKTKYITFLIIVFLILGWVLTSEVVVNKFSVSNVSYNTRVNDIIQSLELSVKNIFFGLGNTDTLKNEIQSRNIQTNSNGLLAMIYTFGGFYAFFYMYRIKKGINYLFCKNTKLQNNVIFIIFIIMFSTEAVYWFQFFCVLLLTYDMREKRLE